MVTHTDCRADIAAGPSFGAESRLPYDGKDRTVQCDTYLVFPEERVCYDVEE